MESKNIFTASNFWKDYDSEDRKSWAFSGVDKKNKECREYNRGFSCPHARYEQLLYDSTKDKSPAVTK